MEFIKLTWIIFGELTKYARIIKVNSLIHDRFNFFSRFYTNVESVEKLETTMACLWNHQRRKYMNKIWDGNSHEQIRLKYRNISHVLTFLLLLTYSLLARPFWRPYNEIYSILHSFFAHSSLKLHASLRSNYIFSSTKNYGLLRVSSI